MEKYIAKWGKEEREFDDVHEAVKFADDKAEIELYPYTSVWVETDGIRAEEPFFYVVLDDI